jgi:ABC-type transport system substrate-binding protein
VFVESDTIGFTSKQLFVDASLNVSRAEVTSISATPSLQSHLGESNLIETLSFSPHAPTNSTALREALSLAINRQALIDSLWGSVTFQTSVGDSVLYSQGADGYPGTSGISPGETTTTTAPNSLPTTANVDCPSCAISLLHTLGYKTTKSGLTLRGTHTALILGVGPSKLDVVSAASIATTWRKLGFAVSTVPISSEMQCAQDVASGRVSAAVYERPTSTSVSYAARSFAGTQYLNAYDSGVRNATTQGFYDQATTNFNPVGAAADWANLDSYVLSSYWVRPLFTAPELLTWSSGISNVYGSYLVAGIVDQITSWNLTPASGQ